jgi:putative ATP-binding cassette transporter
VQIQSGAKLTLLPQRAYVPLGTLRRAAAYPAAADSVDKDELAKALELVGLGHLVERMDEDEPWDQILSGGEKQRLAFARVLLQRPDIVVLDEATSALDPPSQEKLMKLISEELHATTIVSVGHRPELEAYHDRKLVLEKKQGEEAARLVRDVTLEAGRRPRRRRFNWRDRFRRRRRRQFKQAAE